MSGTRAVGVAGAGRGRAGASPAANRGGAGRADEPVDLVSIYAERLRAGAEAPPAFAPRPVVRIGRGTPAFRRQRRAARPRAGGDRTGRWASRRTRLVAAVAGAAIVTTALAGTVLVG